MSPRNVLIGFGEALAAPEVAWSLVDEGFRVNVFVRKSRGCALLHSRHVVCHEITAPESSSQAALAELRSLLISLRGCDGAGPILFPMDDTAVWLCSRAQLPLGALLAGPQNFGARLALNKCLQVRLAREVGFHVPETRLARTAEEVFQFSLVQSFPMILKPAESAFQRDGRIVHCRHWVCANRSELEHAVAEWDELTPLLMQPFLDGTGEGIFGLAAADGVRAWSAHRRLRMMNPEGSGSSACISQRVPEDVRQATQELIRRTEWRGLFMVELLRDRFGTPWFVELNGRTWGSMALSRRQRLEYPAWHLSLAMDERSSAGSSTSYSPGLVCRHAARELLHLLFVFRGPRSRALTRWPSLWKAAGEVLSVQRSETLYNWRRDDPKVFFADCYQTIYRNLFKRMAN